MIEDAGQEGQGNRNTTLIIIAVVVLVLLCCCCSFLVLAWNFGDVFVNSIDWDVRLISPLL